MIEIAKSWIKARWAERSSWDGLTLIGVSIALYAAHALLGWMVPWVAAAGVAYGAYTLIRKEQDNEQ